MFATRFSVFVWLAALAAATTSVADFVVHEALVAAPQGFSSVGPASPDQTLTLRLALAQNNADGLVDALYSVSDPSSSKYGQHMTKDEVNSFVSPTSDTKNALDGWLQANGLTATTLSPAGDWISIQVPVSKANTLFNANFTTFTHESSGKEVVRTLTYSLPQSLQGHVDLVHPTVLFPASKELKSPSLSRKRAFHDVVPRNPASTCANGTTPICLQDMYKIPLTPATHKNNSLGVTGFYGNIAHYSFLQTFLETYRPDLSSATNFSVVSIDGGVNNQTGPSVSEGELDIQYTVGLATDVPITYYFVGIDNQDGALMGFLDEANVLAAMERPPLVLTTSYGFEESSLTFALTQKLCQVYAQLGARGTTILYASGDGAVGCNPSNSTLFEPTFPSNCPFVTSVGGTAGYSPETAWTGSSGGFSNYYPRPAYQAAAVGAYLSAHGTKNAGRFNASGRAFPDIAAKADDFLVYESLWTALQGTSAASPTVASIVALVNDRLLAKGRPPMGFLNPWLYAVGHEAFTDVTTGNSSIRCSATDTPRGFDAVKGWDPVTGLGSPRFDKIVSLLKL